MLDLSFPVHPDSATVFQRGNLVRRKGKGQRGKQAFSWLSLCPFIQKAALSTGTGAYISWHIELCHMP